MLFSQNEYIKCNEIPNTVVFPWPNKQQPVAQICLSVTDQTATSLPKSPYAGFEFRRVVSTEEMKAIVDETKAFLKSKSINNVRIKQAPVFFTPNTEILHNELLKNGFNASSDINHHLPLSNWNERLSTMQKRKIKKCQKEGLFFETNVSSKFDEIYTFLAHCRDQQGLKLNISRVQFQQLLTKLPNHFKIHWVKSQSRELMACLVTVQVTDQIVYGFLPAFDRQYSQLSPLAFLFHEYFDSLENCPVEIFDFGISSINGQPQTGLIQFKEGMGGIPTARHTYSLEW